ncbi:TolB family protein [Pseudomarimonas arenosa]|uniref:PD40 domain-containing protein n=1 Tax=Pseudomarimonas arenosa TaxID=2774145 RepID=A0AAW3ZN90_9GAMM|nr:PD40 domain-containing protein [Pseudomarimonas arenosa]MBD8526970.1 PD40 domain-containing protein [Pseudomarimonas arenosa]
MHTKRPLFVVLLAAFGQASAEQLRVELAPLEALSGHCWIADFGQGKRDVQCFQPMYGGQLLHNTHMIVGSEPRYEGLTVYSWDGEHKRIRFHYFTSQGAVSEGHALPTEGALVFPELHRSSEGQLTELETRMTLGNDHYSVITRRKSGSEWRDEFRADYKRLQGGGATAPLLPLKHQDQVWTLAWNRQTNQQWNAVFRAIDGSLQPVSIARTIDDDAGHWLWDRYQDQLLMLCRSGKSDPQPGWRACRAALGSQRALVNNLRLGDGLWSCHTSGECLVGAQQDGRRRLLRIGADGIAHGALYQGDWEDADPQYSVDGKQLLFRSNRSGSWELWLAAADGSQPRQLTNDPANDAVASHHYGGEGPARFAPGGDWIAWVRRFPDRGFDIWRMDLASGVVRNLTEAHIGDDSYPAVSPDGHWIAFDSERDSAGDSEIFVMPSEGGDAQRISWSPGADLAPIWIPLNKELR